MREGWRGRGVWSGNCQAGQRRVITLCIFTSNDAFDFVAVIICGTYEYAVNRGKLCPSRSWHSWSWRTLHERWNPLHSSSELNTFEKHHLITLFLVYQLWVVLHLCISLTALLKKMWCKEHITRVKTVMNCSKVVFKA